MYLNKIQLIGNITRDPELKVLPNGNKVVSFSIATNRTYKVADEKKEETEFHSIVAFGKKAETIASYFSKGDQIYIEGRVRTRSWEKQPGIKVYRTEIIIDNFQFGRKNIKPESEIKQPEEEETTTNYPDDGIDEDDIPF